MTAGSDVAIEWHGHPRDKSIEATIEIQNPVEPAFPFKIRLIIYDLNPSDSRDKPPKKDERWRAHATFGNELFRLYAATREEAQRRTEDGVRKIFGDLMASVSETKK